MKNKKKYLIITFNTTADAMALEDIFKQNNMSGRLIPIPRQLSSGCGMAYRINIEAKEKVTDIIKQNNLNINELEIVEL